MLSTYIDLDKGCFQSGRSSAHTCRAYIETIYLVYNSFDNHIKSHFQEKNMIPCAGKCKEYIMSNFYTKTVLSRNQMGA